jgi:hypothetical protein
MEYRDAFVRYCAAGDIDAMQCVLPRINELCLRDFELSDDLWERALCTAVRYTQHGVVALLLREHHYTMYEYNAGYYASFACGHTYMLKNIYHKHVNWEALLASACESRRMDIVDYALSLIPARLTRGCIVYHGGLVQAAVLGLPDIFIKLSDLTHAISTEYPYIIIHKICLGGNKRIIEYVQTLYVGRSIFTSCMALNAACAGGHLDYVQTYYPQRRGGHPLCSYVALACRHNHHDILMYLLDAHEPYNVMDVLSYAYEHGYDDLIARVYDVNAINTELRRARIMPMRLSYKFLVHLLASFKIPRKTIQAIYDHECGSNLFDSPCSHKPNMKCVLLLLQHGARASTAHLIPMLRAEYFNHAAALAKWPINYRDRKRGQNAVVIGRYLPVLLQLGVQPAAFVTNPVLHAAACSIVERHAARRDALHTYFIPDLARLIAEYDDFL